MTVEELRAIRLANLGIAPESAKTASVSSADSLALGRIVSGLGAVQAQDYPGTLWALGLRALDCREADVEKAVESGAIVRTWPMRGTLHFVAAADLRWMAKLLTPRVIASTRTRQAQLELDAAQFARSQETMRRVLSGGAVLTREALLAEIEADGISTMGGRGYHLLFRAAMELVICVGPTRNKQQTFALLDDWVPASKELEGESAIAELTWRYFSSHGPASAKDFAGWSGLTMREVKTGLASNQGRLEKVQVAGRDYWWAGDTGTASHGGNSQTAKPKKAGPIVHLLPGFDEFLLGYKERSDVLDPSFAERICPGNNGMFLPTVVIDGQVRGTWKKTFRKSKVVVESQPFTGFTRQERARVADAVGRYGKFYGLTGELI